jgi:hypothetical protein
MKLLEDLRMTLKTIQAKARKIEKELIRCRKIRRELYKHRKVLDFAARVLKVDKEIKRLVRAVARSDRRSPKLRTRVNLHAGTK